jgi:translation initiation factor 2 beta subunit (eIF-2beta)/eIF-5
MPRIFGKVEGRGNGIKTVIVNADLVAQSLKRPPSQVVKFIGLCMGAISRLDEATERYIVNGSITDDELQKHVFTYIDKFVMCHSCGNPETVQGVKGKSKKSFIITLTCKACGKETFADNNHKLCILIAKELAAVEDAKPKPPSPREDSTAGGETGGESGAGTTTGTTTSATGGVAGVAGTSSSGGGGEDGQDIVEKKKKKKKSSDGDDGERKKKKKHKKKSEGDDDDNEGNEGEKKKKKKHKKKKEEGNNGDESGEKKKKHHKKKSERDESGGGGGATTSTGAGGGAETTTTTTSSTNADVHNVTNSMSSLSLSTIQLDEEVDRNMEAAIMEVASKNTNNTMTAQQEQDVLTAAIAAQRKYGLPTTARLPLVFHALVTRAAGGKKAELVTKNKEILTKAVEAAGMEASSQLLGCVEAVVTIPSPTDEEAKTTAYKSIPVLLKALFDCDLLDDGSITSWYNGELEASHDPRVRLGRPDPNLISKGKQSSKILVEWLRQESDEDDDDDEDDDEDDSNNGGGGGGNSNGGGSGNNAGGGKTGSGQSNNNNTNATATKTKSSAGGKGTAQMDTDTESEESD